MSFTGQLAVDELPTYTSLGSTGQLNPHSDEAYLANGCIKVDDAPVRPEPKPAPTSMLAELAAAPVNAFKAPRR